MVGIAKLAMREEAEGWIDALITTRLHKPFCLQKGLPKDIYQIKKYEHIIDHS
jgi:hypothetical protein